MRNRGASLFSRHISRNRDAPDDKSNHFPGGRPLSCRLAVACCLNTICRMEGCKGCKGWSLRPPSPVPRPPSLLCVDFRLRFGSIFRLRVFTAIGALLRCLNQDLGGLKDGHDVARIFNPRLLTGIIFREARCPPALRLPSTVHRCLLSEPGFGGISGWGERVQGIGSRDF